MNSITIVGILLVLVGLYASFRGLAMGKPIVKRNTFREIGDMWVGIIGFYEGAIGFFFIISQI